MVLIFLAKNCRRQEFFAGREKVAKATTRSLLALAKNRGILKGGLPPLHMELCLQSVVCYTALNSTVLVNGRKVGMISS
ncbi:hypothetical protein BLX06_32320 [Bacillus cereus]|uniref:Uncharacterized protein n=1 Tax=Bacillus cereus TaxID=1396 RepID=A0A9X6B366_BACCE|nr:hypothetical protein BLX06_32320 [Bacillus cereus]